MTSSNCLTIRQAVERIINEVTDECVITSCGYISREVYSVNDRPRNFYVQGAMGSALAIGLGLAYQRPDLKVIVISGDGAILMSAGTYALMGYLIEEKKLSNLTCIVLRNNSYASTGGQLNCYHYFDTGSIGAFKEIEVGETSDAPRIPLTCKEIKERFVESIRIRD